MIEQVIVVLLLAFLGLSVMALFFVALMIVFVGVWMAFWKPLLSLP